MKAPFAIVIGVLLASAVGYASWQVPAPKVEHATIAQPTSPTLVLAGWVTDAANLLTPAEEVTLSKRLAAFEARTGHQLVVVTVPTLNGQNVAKYSLALAIRWGIGRKGYNDGLMLLVAPNERKVRIEVGLGLERALPDALCAKILQDDVLPRFRDGDYPTGINAGVTALMSHSP